ncbi:MAG: hypothetical protein KAX19_01330, partial [Candidatus Brocadiae bacterium]|nr:hypothetical protein [Candidatus Brocadiia bacterium]
MTWRAFFIGLLAVIGLTALDPYTSFNKGYGWTTTGHFPAGAVFLLIFFTVILNLAIKLVRKRWALTQAELMLIWCMLIVSCGVACNGLMRYWFSGLAGPPYLARRADILWQDTALDAAPEGLLLSKSPNSLAAQRFFEGKPADSRLPWEQWAAPIAHWSVFIGFFYLAVLFMCGMLRKQWVENERLQFPLARVPLEFTEGSADGGLLPRLFANRAFLAGLVFTGAFRLLRISPLFFGRESGWGITIPFKDALQGTPLGYTYLENVPIWWDVIGFAYLVPADVSLSIWFFYLFGRFELQTASWLRSPLHYGGTWSELMSWQTAGSYMTFTLG